MLPRSLFLIIVASCWLQINAVPFQSRDDYQELQDEGEDLLDYAFTENEGVEPSGLSDNEAIGGFEGIEASEAAAVVEGSGGVEGAEGTEIHTGAEQTSDKTSMLESIKDTMVTMHELGVLKDKNNINVNANSPKYKKKTKKPKPTSHKRSEPKLEASVVSRRSSQQFPKNIPDDLQIINERKRNIAGVKSRNHCNEARRTITNNYSQTISLNSSYLGIDEDFTVNSQAKMKKTHTVFTDDYITLCWIETTTIKIDNSTKPPKRLVIRESTITFENAAVIPDEYLSCPFVEGDISLESPEAVCHTLLSENIGDDTRYSRAVNLTSTVREGDIDVQVNKVIRCTMGSIITKDVYRWLNPAESTRQRVEIKVSPEIYKTQELCAKKQRQPKFDTVPLKNDSSECSDENEQDRIKDTSEKGKNITECLDGSCSDEEAIVATTKPLNVSGIHSISSTTESSSITKLMDTVTQPTVIPGIDEKLLLKKPKTLDISSPTGNLETPIEFLTKKPSFTPNPDDTILHPTIHPGINDKLSTIKSPHSSELNDVSTVVTKSPVAIKTPKILIPIESELHLPQQSLDIPCIGPDCPKNNSVNIPTGNMTLGKEKAHNITSTSDEESCEGADCEDIESINDAEIDEISDLDHEKKNMTASSEKLLEREKNELYIPKPFICPVKNQKICDHLEQVSKLQGQGSGSEENVEELVNVLKELADSNELLSNEGGGVELGDFIPLQTATTSVKPVPSPTLSTVALSQSSSVEHIISTQVPKSTTSHGISSHESESISSFENLSNELKTFSSSEEGSSKLPSGTKPPLIFANRTQATKDSSYGEELDSLSQEMERNYGSNETELNESCDESGNCRVSNTSYISRISSPSSVAVESVSKVTPSMESNDTKLDLGLHSEEEDGEDESCDCDDDSPESSKCDPKSGTCISQTRPIDDKVVTQPMLNDDADNSQQKENMTTVSGRQGPTSPTLIDKDRVMGVGTDAAGELLQNHKLSLKIHVTLGHIDENKENHELAQVEKDVLLNELPEQHGNHSLYWHIKALNQSANDIDSLRDMFNCTLLGKLTEEAIIDRLNMTQLKERMVYDDDDDDESYSRRRRRNADNVTLSSNGHNHNESSTGHSIIKECILPNIREDIKNGLADMLSQIMSALNHSKNNAPEKSNNNATTAVKGNADSADASKMTTVVNRNKRSLMSTNGVEELSRWSNERFTPSNDGGQLRSFTELKILQNPVGVK